MNGPPANSPPPRAFGVAVCSCLVVFLSAFLLFQVQPVISSCILPWFGGGPSVWTTCMLFFQVTLLAGYALAHLLASKWQPWHQSIVHLALAGAALAVLPILPADSWKPVDGQFPTWRIILLLTAVVGAPYLVLAATAPLVQYWYSRFLPDRSAYRLYALSNVGSLGALLTYPFLVERYLNIATQTYVWSAGFAVYTLFCGLLLLSMFRGKNHLALAPPSATNKSIAAKNDVVSAWQRLIWLVLPMLASVMLLATTSHTCQDVAVIPLLWIAPLSLYLLSFILCFDHPRWYQREAFCVLTIVVMLVVSWREQLLEWLDRWLEQWNMPPTQLSSMVLEVVPPLAMMFLVCMLCHGEVARLKPHPRKLTEFYLFIAIGGALGGVVTAVICPLVFSTYLEYPIVVVLGYMLALSILFDALWHRLPPRWAPAAMLIVLLPAAGMVVVVRAQRSEQLDPAEVTVRNFYGVLRVEDVAELGTALYHGRIQHGFQYWDEADRRTATTYYDPPSGVGLAMNHMQPAANRRIAVVGLGTGTMASYGQPGDQLYFFEINPMVVEIARTHFTYLSDTPAQVQIQVGDGRLLLQRMQGAGFDVIVLDAFSGDAIPAHLLTMEAFQVYLNCLDPRGIIAVHVSNRYLDLKPIVARLAHEYSMQAIWIERDIVESDADAASDWVLVTRDQAFVEDDNIQQARSEIDGDPAEFPLWTDHYHSLFEILIPR